MSTSRAWRYKVCDSRTRGNVAQGEVVAGGASEALRVVLGAPGFVPDRKKCYTVHCGGSVASVYGDEFAGVAASSTADEAKMAERGLTSAEACDAVGLGEVALDELVARKMAERVVADVRAGNAPHERDIPEEVKRQIVFYPETGVGVKPSVPWDDLGSMPLEDIRRVSREIEEQAGYRPKCTGGPLEDPMEIARDLLGGKRQGERIVRAIRDAAAGDVVEVVMNPGESPEIRARIGRLNEDFVPLPSVHDKKAMEDIRKVADDYIRGMGEWGGFVGKHVFPTATDLGLKLPEPQRELTLSSSVKIPPMLRFMVEKSLLKAKKVGCWDIQDVHSEYMHVPRMHKFFVMVANPDGERMGMHHMVTDLELTRGYGWQVGS